MRFILGKIKKPENHLVVLSHVWIHCQIPFCRSIQFPAKSEKLAEMKYPKLRKNPSCSARHFLRLASTFLWHYHPLLLSAVSIFYTFMKQYLYTVQKGTNMIVYDRLWETMKKKGFHNIHLSKITT